MCWTPIKKQAAQDVTKWKKKKAKEKLLGEKEQLKYVWQVDSRNSCPASKPG